MSLLPGFRSIPLAVRAGCRTSSSSSSSSTPRLRKARDLSSIISLYQSSSSFPVVAAPSSSSISSNDGLNPLQHYVDAKLLGRNKLRPLGVDGITDQQSARSSNANNDFGQSERYSYMYSDSDNNNNSDFLDPFDAAVSSSGKGYSRNPMDLTAPRRSVKRANWKPFSNTATKEQKERGKRIIDALSGTVDASFPGERMVEEAWEVMEKRVRELHSTAAAEEDGRSSKAEE